MSFCKRVDGDADMTQGCTACKWKRRSPTLSDSLPFKFWTIQSYFSQLSVLWDNDTHNMLGLRCTCIPNATVYTKAYYQICRLNYDVFLTLLNIWFLVLVAFKSLPGTLMTVWHLREMQVWTLVWYVGLFKSHFI